LLQPSNVHCIISSCITPNALHSKHRTCCNSQQQITFKARKHTPIIQALQTIVSDIMKAPQSAGAAGTARCGYFYACLQKGMTHPSFPTILSNIMKAPQSAGAAAARGGILGLLAESHNTSKLCNNIVSDQMKAL
jgi:hypothetical protein